MNDQEEFTSEMADQKLQETFRKQKESPFGKVLDQLSHTIGRGQMTTPAQEQWKNEQDQVKKQGIATEFSTAVLNLTNQLLATDTTDYSSSEVIKETEIITLRNHLIMNNPNNYREDLIEHDPRWDMIRRNTWNTIYITLQPQFPDVFKDVSPVDIITGRPTPLPPTSQT